MNHGEVPTLPKLILPKEPEPESGAQAPRTKEADSPSVLEKPIKRKTRVDIVNSDSDSETEVEVSCHKRARVDENPQATEASSPSSLELTNSEISVSDLKQNPYAMEVENDAPLSKEENKAQWQCLYAFIQKQLTAEGKAIAPASVPSFNFLLKEIFLEHCKSINIEPNYKMAGETIWQIMWNYAKRERETNAEEVARWNPECALMWYCINLKTTTSIEPTSSSAS